jgi:hypothetical protein
MRILYSNYQRSSDDRTKFADVPPEVVRQVFVYLSHSDLASSRLVCRAWNPAAQDVLMSQVSIDEVKGNGSLCGLTLRSIVGFERYSIKSLDLNINSASSDRQLLQFHYSKMLHPYYSHSLTSLRVYCKRDDGLTCFLAFQSITRDCSRLRNLQLVGYDFGANEGIWGHMEESFGRLIRLDLICCRGDVASFLKFVGVSNLLELSYASQDDTAQDSEDIIIAIALNCPNLTSIRLEAKFDSSASIVKLVECCSDLKRLIYHNKNGSLKLSRSDIFSLRRLKGLDIDCPVEADAVSAFKIFDKLKSLRIVDWGLSEVIRTIGGNLVYLEIGRVSAAVLKVIVKWCGNIKYLEISGRGDVIGTGVEVGLALKKKLKKLAKLRVNGVCVRLGTDWEGE